VLRIVKLISARKRHSVDSRQPLPPALPATAAPLVTKQATRANGTSTFMLLILSNLSARMIPLHGVSTQLFERRVHLL